jgi:hypothetical protein
MFSPPVTCSKPRFGPLHLNKQTFDGGAPTNISMSYGVTNFGLQIAQLFQVKRLDWRNFVNLSRALVIKRRFCHQRSLRLRVFDRLSLDRVSRSNDGQRALITKSK